MVDYIEEYEDIYSNDLSEQTEPYDIEKTINQLREAWECVPNMSLFDLIDEILINGMTPDEVSEALDEFIIQNQ